MPYRCDGEHEDCPGVTTLITDLAGGGETLAFCPDYLVGWARAFLEALDFRVQEPPEIAEAANGAAQEADPGPAPGGTKSGQDQAQEVPPELAASASPFPDPTPDDS